MAALRDASTPLLLSVTIEDLRMKRLQGMVAAGSTHSYGISALALDGDSVEGSDGGSAIVEVELLEQQQQGQSLAHAQQHAAAAGATAGRMKSIRVGPLCSFFDTDVNFGDTLILPASRTDLVVIRIVRPCSASVSVSGGGSSASNINGFNRGGSSSSRSDVVVLGSCTIHVSELAVGGAEQEEWRRAHDPFTGMLAGISSAHLLLLLLELTYHDIPTQASCSCV